MRRIITILFAVASMCSSVMAQSVAGVKIDVQSFEYQSDSVRLNIEYNLNDIEIGSKESVIFTPKIFKQEQTLALPALVVKRRGGARSYDRAMALGNEKSVEMYEELYGTPAQIIDYYGKGKQDVAQYSVSVPYQTWMVDSQLYVDCTTYGCCSSQSDILVPNNSGLLIDIPTVEACDIFADVELVKPEKVAIKRRDIQYSAAMIFRVNSTYLDPNLANNKAEIASIDEMMQEVISDSDYTITKVNIIGFASPEGSLESNMRLSEGRAGALEKLMKRAYKVIKPELYSVKFGGENWGKLYEIVSESSIDYRDEVLDIIANTSIEHGREMKLMDLNGGATYKYLLRNFFPATRLVMVDVEYNVDAYDIVRIGELIDTKPQNLSLEEMYRLSETFDIEDEEFEKIFLTAARIYPKDEVAQNNALVTEIRRGNLESVSKLAQSVDQNTNSAELANSLGAYYMMSGEYDKATAMLQRALQLGNQRAENNMLQLNKKLENIRKAKANAALRAKIYGDR